MLTESQYLQEKTLFHKSDCPPDSIKVTPLTNERGPLKIDLETEYHLMTPERAINGTTNWDSSIKIGNKTENIECRDGKVITKNEDIKNLLISQGWILIKSIKGE